MKVKRRDLIAVLGAAGVAFLLRRYISGGARSIAPKVSTGNTKEVTPNDEFYITHYDGVPEIDIDAWRLVVTGDVERELSLGLDEIKAFPETLDYNTLICIGNDIGGQLIGNARWKGVLLKDVLTAAGLKDTAKEVVLHGADGYNDSFPLEKALNMGTRLVYEMNEALLPEAHGYPLRAVVPGLYGIKNVKWIEKIEVSREEVRGYWQKRGWGRDGIIKMMSRIDMPHSGDLIKEGVYEVSGVAFGGKYPITKVEVSSDGGKTWGSAVLKTPLS